MKTVVAALIEKDGKYLIAKRKPSGSLANMWEFPGGKVEVGETEPEALEREILEEFNTLVEVGKRLASASIDSKTILKLYACKHKLGGYHANDHSEIAWVSNFANIAKYDLAPADIELLDKITKDKRTTSLNELEIGASYKNDDIVRIFLVSSQSGMRKSNRANSLVLLSLHNSGNPYEDNWGEDGIMHYTGMGLSGDQSIDYMQNKTLAESRTNSIDIHLFESFEPNEYIYRGQVELANDPYYVRQKDENSRDRQVVKFPLRIKRSE